MRDPTSATATVEFDRDAGKILTFEAASALVCDYIGTTKRDSLAAAIFGSVAKGCNNANSDIDILLVSSKPTLTKQNVNFCGHRLQLIDGSAGAIRHRIMDAATSRNDFIVSVILDSRWVSGSEQLLDALRIAAEPISRAGMPPMHLNQYLSVRSRCADAIEKIRSTSDVHHRMFVGCRIYALLQELAAANSRISLYTGTAGYPQFVQLAPNFAPAMAYGLRKAIAADDYDDFVDSVKIFFERAGGFSWACDNAIPI